MATQISSGDTEDFPDSFTCCICLDLLYKPVVLACGHFACFWCVHKSMDSICESHCPVCRHPYYHFPTISQTLHFLLLKLYPVAYRRREEQTLEEEKEMGFFSPQFDLSTHRSHDNKEKEHSNHLGSSCTITESESFSNPCSTGNEEKNGSRKQLLITDVECSSCKQLLFRPVFLNCGHGYCEACISSPDAEVLKCHICPSTHPAGVLKVCLELDHFLEKQFPVEYALRREAVQPKQVQIKNERNNGNSGSTTTSKKDFPFLSLAGDEVSPLKMHPRVGCDYCGMLPIIGDRYKCMDCVEKIGFDLCGDCYNNSSKLPGRFNQQHTPDHKFMLVDSKFPFVRPEQLAEFHIAMTNYITNLGIPENESPDSPTDTDPEDSTGNS